MKYYDDYRSPQGLLLLIVTLLILGTICLGIILFHN